MTLDEIVAAALARVDFAIAAESVSRSVFYRRIAGRVNALLVDAAKANPDFTGTDDEIDYTADGGVALGDLSWPVLAVTDVQIGDPGTSTVRTAGERVTLTSVRDAALELAPRALLRDGAIVGYGTDLDGIATLRVFYARGSDLALSEPAADDSPDDLPALFHELLVIDCARYALTSLAPTPQPDRVTALTAEEGEWMSQFLAYVRTQNAAQTVRFAS